ncbi:alpha/beta hydrolase [Thioclava sp. FR2]|uniref:alpha/beta hydrolase n=1 Tax=Thioclava sp. FR2 TaxID=3445780 RepID=UPI003EBA0958
MEFRSQADRDYANRAFIPGADAFIPRWQAAASAFRHELKDRARLGLTYGPSERNKFDLFLPETPPEGLMVFVHGGYWLAFDRSDWSHLAAGALARGWACAMPSYTLAPTARIGEMVNELRAAVLASSALVPGKIIVTGHSAGGHLSARMGCEDGPAGVARVVPISPLADLRPLMATEMNKDLRLDEKEALAESPAYLFKTKEVSAHVWVGGNERPAFLWQARVLSEEWSCPWTVDPGRHHFDVIDGLTDSNSPLMDAIMTGV